MFKQLQLAIHLYVEVMVQLWSVYDPRTSSAQQIWGRPAARL